MAILHCSALRIMPLVSALRPILESSASPNFASSASPGPGRGEPEPGAAGPAPPKSRPAQRNRTESPSNRRHRCTRY
eukprot:3001747-Rhodomonas_salina.1